MIPLSGVVVKKTAWSRVKWCSLPIVIMWFGFVVVWESITAMWDKAVILMAERQKKKKRKETCGNRRPPDTQILKC